LDATTTGIPRDEGQLFGRADSWPRAAAKHASRRVIHVGARPQWTWLRHLTAARAWPPKARWP